MNPSGEQAPSESAGQHLLLYDGVCGLCDRLLQFVLVHDRARAFTFAALQSGVGRSTVRQAGGDPDQLDSLYVVVDYRTPRARVLVRSRAALFVAGAIGWPWRAAAALGMLPTWLLDRAYDFIARHRYRVFGRVDRCLIPSPEHRARFIDSDERRMP